jgi:hypothetical protein
MAFPRPSAPATVRRDLKALIASRERHQLVFFGLSVFMTILIFFGFAYDFRDAHVVPPPIIYVESWPANRTDAEIKRDQKADSDARHAAQKERQRQFQKLARDLGIE